MSGSFSNFVFGVSAFGSTSPSGSTTAWPPTEPTTLAQTIPAYLYAQYADDENLQALFAAYNQLAQAEIDWFANIQLPVYTGSQISGSLLDWVAEGLYGISRPALPFGSITTTGPIDTWTPNQIAVNAMVITGSVDEFTVNDDIFKRIITWFFFKGDGQQYSTQWLKRRVMRFLIGSFGAAPNIDNTYPVSVFYEGAGRVLVTIIVGLSGITQQVAQIFAASVASGAISLPFQLQFSVTTIGAGAGLQNDGGVLQVTDLTGWPLSPASLPPGSLWSNGSSVSVVPGYTLSGSPLFFGSISSLELLTIGGASMPTSNPGSGSGQLWNNGAVVCIA